MVSMLALPCSRAAAALPAPQAVYLLKAERIGHGYHVLEDPELYRELLKTRMHFEVRPRRCRVGGGSAWARPCAALPARSYLPAQLRFRSAWLILFYCLELPQPGLPLVQLSDWSMSSGLQETPSSTVRLTNNA